MNYGKKLLYKGNIMVLLKIKLLYFTDNCEPFFYYGKNDDTMRKKGTIVNYYLLYTFWLGVCQGIIFVHLNGH